ncbi:MAG: hypothetical protein K8R38_05080 [Verrucomicrobia bacterium]|nr:hypothetical protein [Verrucomicrobiota bacterium]
MCANISRALVAVAEADAAPAFRSAGADPLPPVPEGAMIDLALCATTRGLEEINSPRERTAARDRISG